MKLFSYTALITLVIQQYSVVTEVTYDAHVHLTCNTSEDRQVMYYTELMEFPVCSDTQAEQT